MFEASRCRDLISGRMAVPKIFEVAESAATDGDETAIQLRGLFGFCVGRMTARGKEEYGGSRLAMMLLAECAARRRGRVSPAEAKHVLAPKSSEQTADYEQAG